MRPRLVEVYSNIAREWARRSTCPKAQVGAVAYDIEGQILASGYNGAPRGLPHCLDAGCLEEGGHCVRAVHAELNVILQAARQGTSLMGASLLTTHRPCVRCTQAIIQVGFAQVIFLEPYDTDQLLAEVKSMFELGDVELRGGYGK